MIMHFGNSDALLLAVLTGLMMVQPPSPDRIQTPRALRICYTPDHFFRLLCLLPAEAGCKISLCSDFSDWCIRNYQDKVSYFI